MFVRLSFKETRDVVLLAMNYYRNKNVYGVNDEYERYAERLYLFTEKRKIW